jgi:hypothetical protein
LAGHEWAHPDTLPEAQTKAEMREMGLGENFEAGQQVPAEQLGQRELNARIDERYPPTTHPEENAQLKGLVREGDDAAAINEAERYFKSGHGALITPPAPERPRDPRVIPTMFGDTIRPDPTLKNATSVKELDRQKAAVGQLGSQGQKLSARKAILRDELMKSLRLAVDNNDLSTGHYIFLRQALDKNDFAKVKEALTNIGDTPSRYIMGRDGPIITGRDRVAAANLLDKIIDSDGSARTAMAHLAMSPDVHIANMARRYARFVPANVKIEVVDRAGMQQTLGRLGEELDTPETDTTHGLWVPKEGTIYLSTTMPHSATALHEIVHSIIGDHVNKGTAIGREITSIYNRFKNLGPKNDYAFTSANEFIAEFLSRKQVRDYVRDWSRARQAGSLFGRLWEAIRKALGMPRP